METKPLLYVNRVMRKAAFCICENKAADQLCHNRTADQRLCFRYIHVDSTVPLLPKSKFEPLAIFCSCTARFALDLVGNPEDRFSHDAAHVVVVLGFYIPPQLYEQQWCISAGAPSQSNAPVFCNNCPHPRRSGDFHFCPANLKPHTATASW